MKGRDKLQGDKKMSLATSLVFPDGKMVLQEMNPFAYKNIRKTDDM